MPENIRATFVSDGHAVHREANAEKHYVNATKIAKVSISKDTYVEFSAGVAELSDYFGVASDLIACHKFSRKSKVPAAIHVHVRKDTKNADHIISLARAKNQSKEHANGRGDIEGTPAFF